MRFPTLLILAVAAPLAAAPAIQVAEIPSPAAPWSLGPSLAAGPDGTAWLSWIEPEAASPAAAPAHAHGAAKPARANTLKFARYEAAATRWSAAAVIARDASVAPSSADFPQLAIDGQGTAHALWTDGRGGAFLSRSTDAATWSRPVAWSLASTEVEKFALTRLEGGRVLVAWLDGRAHASTPRPQQLFARFIDAPEATEVCIDASVCDCCQTSLSPLLDGGALVAYRGRTGDEIRDIMTARLRGARWDRPNRVNADDWKINGCPVNGPRVSTVVGRAATAWYTGAANEPKVLASFSPDAGRQWLMPLRIDRGHPVGHVDTVILRDSSLLVTWLEADGTLWLRRITPDFVATEPVLLAAKVAVRGVPRLLLRHDYEGGRGDAELFLTYTADGADGGVRVLRITVPEGELLAAERKCDCTPTPEELRSVALRGRITAVDPATNTVRVAHGEIPGVLSAGTDPFTIAPLLLASLQTDAEFLGRIDRGDDGRWQLLEIRLLGATAP